MDDKKRGFYPSVLVGDALLLLCALMGLAGSFLSLHGDPDAPLAEATALDRCAADGAEFLLYAALFAVIALAVFSLPRFWGWAAGALAALWLGAVALCWTQAVQGAGLTVRLISIQFARRVDWGKVFQYDPGLTFRGECDAVRLFLILALAGLALLVGWAVVRARCWWLTLEFTLPFLLPGLLADLYPDWLWFMALAACWCVMLVTSLCKWAAPTGRGRLTLAVFPAVAAVLAAITLIFPREGYTRPPWALKAQEDLVNLASHVSDFFHWDGPFQGGTVTYVGAAEEADLAHAGPLNYSGRTVLRVNSDYEGRMYLRGSSLAVYEDGVWKALPEEAWQEWQEWLDWTEAQNNMDPFRIENGPDAYETLSPLVLPAWESGYDRTYTATIDNAGAVGACVYTPYFVTPQDWTAAGMLPVEDSYIARKQGQWVHTVSFAELGHPSDNAGRGAVYRAFAREHYLDVPDALWEQLQITVLEGWQSGAWGYSAAYMSSPSLSNDPIQAAWQVRDYLAAFCEYDPAAPAAPEGTDPVLYFLNESRRGYCMHYASAATLILRSGGIPARYVSGFTVDSVPNRQVIVPDRAAHAWVEVWVDGFGWYPVEVTPAAAFTWYEQGTLGTDGPGLADPTQQPTPTPQPTQAPDPVATAPGTESDPSGPADSGPDLTALYTALKRLGAAAGVVFLLWLAQFLTKRRRARRMAGPDPNRAALACYGYLCRLERWGGKIDERAVELAQKAKFSQHTLTEDELALLRRLVDGERARVCAEAGLPKRLAFRCLWGKPKNAAPPAGEADS